MRAAVKGYGRPLRGFSFSRFLHHIRPNQKYRALDSVPYPAKNSKYKTEFFLFFVLLTKDY